MKKLHFTPGAPWTEKNSNKPVPSKKTIPEFYKKMPYFFGKDNKMNVMKTEDNDRPIVNLTLKNCVPFLDVFLTGYTLCLTNDVWVEPDDDGVNFAWAGGGENFIGGHMAEQWADEQIPSEFHQGVFKFKNQWVLKSPEGYSVLYTHPLNRTDLPFYTFSGIVDEDVYPNNVELPFILKKGFSGLIPNGTPIAQLIPIKRESWTHEIHPYDEDARMAADESLFTQFVKYYKQKFWHRKDYS